MFPFYYTVDLLHSECKGVHYFPLSLGGLGVFIPLRLGGNNLTPPQRGDKT